MVIVTQRYDIHPDKIAAYVDWFKNMMPELLAQPGLIQVCGYRMITGSSQVMGIFEFASLADFATWKSSAVIARITNEIYALTLNTVIEVWETSPLTPTPIRPNS